MLVDKLFVRLSFGIDNDSLVFFYLDRAGPDLLQRLVCQDMNLMSSHRDDQLLSGKYLIVHLVHMSHEELRRGAIQKDQGLGRSSFNLDPSPGPGNFRVDAFQLRIYVLVLA